MKKKTHLVIVGLLALSYPPVVAQVDDDDFDSGPLGHWTFDECSWAGDCVTADILDSSGNERHGIACIDGDAPFPVPGKSGSAGRFDGINHYANMGPGFNFTSSFTASVWISLDDYDWCGPIGASQHIIGTHDLRTPIGNGRGWGIYWDCDGLAWELTNSTGSAIGSYGYVQPSPFPTNGSWHHAVLVYDSSIPSATLYWDGAPVHSESGTANVPDSLFDNGEPLTVNGLPYAPSSGAPGKIDDTRVFDRALSDAEIEDLFNETSTNQRVDAMLFQPLCTRDASGLPEDVYDSVSVGLINGSSDAFYLSSARRSFEPLVADDELHVNGASCGPGPYAPLVPEFLLGAPIEQNLDPEPSHDVSSCIPAGTSQVLFEILDTDRSIYGNTAVYLVRDCGIHLEKQPDTTVHWISHEVDIVGIQSDMNVATGLLTELIVDRDFSRSCELGSFLDTTQVVDSRADPPGGDGYYYVVSGTCGQPIAYGNSSDGPRSGLPPSATCP